MDAIPGARESNAGDDFHVLWAARRTLGLLDPCSDLQLVAMEDLFPFEGEIDPALLLGVDLTEYFGGRSFESAGRVVVSQLKYSHRNPGTPWTAARLCQGSKRPSVIRRLGDIYRGIAKTESRKRLLEVLRIRLVSNMPMGEQLAESLASAQSKLAEVPGQLGRAKLFEDLPETAREDLRRLHGASKLGSRDFTDFLRVLELDLGQLPRYEQELSMTAALGNHVRADLEHHSRVLYDLVRRKAEPEGHNSPIAREDLLAALGVYDLKQLLPAPSKIKALPADLIQTPEPQRILAALHSGESRMVIAHGNAGVGKTTSVSDLLRVLPEGSVVITLDCFAGGDYLKPAHFRHLPRRALLQLCNELAVACRLPLLLKGPSSAEDLWLELEQRLRAAAESVSASGGKVLIVVDAIDNSAWAAKAKGDPSFVADLWQLSVPDGAGLIATARTARLHLLDAPDGTPEVKLGGFDEAGSAAHLRRSFPDADPDAAREFHKRSQGNPRVQSYVFDVVLPDPQKGLADAVELANRTPEDIFEDDLWAAAEQVGGADWALQRLADLMCLTAPVRVERLEELAGPDGNVAGFCDALAPGLRIEAGEVTIQDEDFERFLSDKLTEEGRRAAHERLADLFSESASEDPYAASVLADHLFGSGRVGELISLAIDGSQPAAIEDPLARLQVYLTRVRLALRCSGEADERLQAAKLLRLAADAKTTDAAITNVIRERPELSLRYGDPETVSSIWRADENLDWQGPVHMRLAALAARAGERSRAEAELRATDAWLTQRHEREEDWDVSREALAAAMEALFLLDGWDRAMESLQRWRPWPFVWDTAEELMERLREHVPRKGLARKLLATELPPQVKARLLIALRCEPEEIPEAPLLRVARALANSPTRPSHREGGWPTDFAELLARRTGKRRLVVRLLAVLEPPLPNYAPSAWHGTERFRDPLRCQALRAACRRKELDIEALMPDSTKERKEEDYQAKERRASERAEMQKNIGPLVSIYARRGRALLGRPMAHSIAPALRTEIKGYGNPPHYAAEDGSGRYRRWVSVACDLIVLARGISEEVVEDAAQVGFALDAPRNPYACELIARKLLPDARYREQALRIVERAAASAEELEQPASDLTEFLLDLAQTADTYDHDLAAGLYERAVRASAGLDDFGIVPLEQHTRIAPSLTESERADALAQRVGEVLVSYRTRVSDEERLPWRRTLRSVTELSPGVGIAMAGRWEDHRYQRIADSIESVVLASLEAGLLSPRDGLALIGLMDERTPRARPIRRLLDALAAEGGSGEVAEEVGSQSLVIRRDLLAVTRRDAARALRDWATERGLGGLRAVEALSPYDSYPREREPGYSSSAPYRREERDQEQKALLRKAASCEPEEFAELSAEAAREAYGEPALLEVLSAAADGLAPSRRLELLGALGRITTEHSLFRFHGVTALTFIDGLLRKWQGSKGVARWRATELAPLLDRQLPGLARFRETNEECLLGVRQLLGAERTAELAVEAAAGGVERFGADALHALARFVVDAVDTEERADYLEWSLALLEGDGPTSAPSASVFTREEALAGLLWALMANPDKWVRWRAAHVGRSLIGLQGGGELAGELLRLSGTRDGGSFCNPELQFYWMSGQTWALMTLARAAAENPEAIAPHAKALAKIALDRDWPHALVRRYARDAALATVGSAGCDLTEGEIADLEVATLPLSCFAERDSHYGAHETTTPGAERWHFDMDTDSYWFSRLGEHFQISSADVGFRAERWLIDRLGETPEPEPRWGDVRVSGVDYGARDNHHGSRPRIEEPRLTLEYNALHLVAGELIDEGHPILVEYYDPVTDPWEDWLEGHANELPDRWVSDLREPTPPEPLLLDADIRDDRWPTVTEDQFDLLLGHPGEGPLIISAYIDYHSAAGYAWDAVRSALVTPSRAASLTRALESAENMSFFGFPTGDESSVHDGWIEHSSFRLISWLHETEQHREGVDRSDPLARISLGSSVPGKQFRQFHDASAERGGELRGPDGRRLAWVRRFSDEPPPERGYESRFYAAGTLTYVEPDALLSFLSSVNMTLIIKVEMKRRDKTSEEQDGEHDQEIQRAIVIDQSGQIKGLQGNRAIG